jgi:hypothetical protein
MVQAGVKAIEREEFVVRASLDDTALRSGR